MVKSRGFTLLEIMLVIVLVATMAVAVIATVPNSKEDNAKENAQGLYQQLLLLNDEAILSGNDYGLYIDEEHRKYRLLTLKSKGWEKINLDGMKAEHTLAEGIDMSFELGSDRWQDSDRLFEPGTLFDEDMFKEEDEEDKIEPPQIYILSSSEVTPATIYIYPEDGNKEEDGWVLKIKENSEIILLEPGSDEDE